MGHCCARHQYCRVGQWKQPCPGLYHLNLWFNAPLAIVSPANGATISGLITVSGTASDTVSISSVAVSVDGGAYALATGTSNWTFSLDTASLTNGSHTITAKAWDCSGNTALISSLLRSTMVVPFWS